MGPKELEDALSSSTDRSELEEQLKSNIRAKLHEARHKVPIADKLDKLDKRQDVLESNIAEIRDLLRRAIPGIED